MQILLFDTKENRQSLFPLTTIRSVADIRIGMLTIRERWELLTKKPVTILTEDYLAETFTASNDDLLYIDSTIIPEKNLFDAIIHLKQGSGIRYKNQIIAMKTKERFDFGFHLNANHSFAFIEWERDIRNLQYPFQITQWNDEVVKFDFELLTNNRKSQPVSATNSVINPGQVFLEDGAVVEYCILNASEGPIYIGKDSLVMEGSMIRGAFAMLDNSIVKMGAKIYGATSIGKNCTVGGEIKNVVFFDYSNKAHDGYLGDSVIGQWCNLGAGTSCSNVKNTAGEVKIWNPLLHQWINAGFKCGAIMGDYTRTAINTSLNTGTTTGICCNIVQTGFPPKYIEQFTWNTASKERYVLEKVFIDIANWKQLKHHQLTEKEKSILHYLYQLQS